MLTTSTPIAHGCRFPYRTGQTHFADNAPELEILMGMRTVFFTITALQQNVRPLVVE
jgi:hypothetical protein